MADTTIGMGKDSNLKLVDLGDGTYAYGIPATSSASPYLHIAGAATTVVKSGPGIFRRLLINKAVALSTITIYDNVAASGTIIAIIAQPVALLAAQVCLPYEISFTTGLTLVTSAADDVTVVYN